MIDIEPVTFIMSCLLMCVFSVPFIYNGQKNKKISRALLANLNEMAKSQGANLTEIDSWRNRYALGLDSQHKVLSYMRLDSENVSYNLNLGEFKSVKLIKNYQEINGKPQTHKLPEYVGLELIPNKAEAGAVNLEIYDAELYSDLMGETVLAEKWLGILNKQLN